MKRNRPVRSVFSGTKQAAERDMLNREGFPAYSADIYTDTVNVLMTGTIANTFYCSAVELASEQVAVLEKCAQEDPEFLAKACIYAREQGYQKLFPVAGLVALSKYDPGLFQAIAPRVCRLPSDWTKFIDIARSKAIRRGCGKVVKQAIAEYIASLRDSDHNEYYALKYRSHLRDMIHIAHVNPSVNPVLVRWVMNGIAEGEQIAAYKRLATTASDREKARIIREYRLPWEQCTTFAGDSTEVWTALMEVAPYFNLIRNLNNFDRHGVLQKRENVEYCITRITNEEAVRNSKLFPFRFYAAYAMVAHPEIKNALARALEISVDNIPDTDERVAICSDVSGSMSSHLTGDYSVVQCIDVVGIFTGALLRKCRNSVFLPFDDGVRMDIVDAVSRCETVAQVVTTLNRMYGGGTSLAAPIDLLLSENRVVDRMVAFTDNEEWLGGVYSEHFEGALSRYIREVNPDVQVYLVTLLPYRDYPVRFTEGLSRIGSASVHGVFGWSDSVLRYVLSGDQVREVKQTPLELS